MQISGPWTHFFLLWKKGRKIGGRGNHDSTPYAWQLGLCVQQYYPVTEELHKLNQQGIAHVSSPITKRVQKMSDVWVGIVIGQQGGIHQV